MNYYYFYQSINTSNFSSSKNLYGEAPQFDTDVLLNFYDTNVCYRRGIYYPEKWILPHNKYCETSMYILFCTLLILSIIRINNIDINIEKYADINIYYFLYIFT